ncbi:MAG: precorrin-8X methylmutase [Deltaproteobacteria bacterium]|nr:precorrin-8X methylmutase [Deltaproteobacteria bacterium]
MLDSMTKPTDKKAVLLLGHGSKLNEANETLCRIAASIEARGGYGCVQPAFLQLKEPDFQEAIAMMVSKGFYDIVVMPYFLYPGAHVTKDIPAEMEVAAKGHPGLKFTMAGNLGFHDALVDLTRQRIEESLGNGAPRAASPKPLVQHPIEKESFRIIDETLSIGQGVQGAAMPFSALELPVVRRVIHTTADFEYKDLLRFSGKGLEAGLNALARGCSIVTDVKMVDAGVSRQYLERFGSKVFCFSSDADVQRVARVEGITKTAASMRKAAGFLDGGIAAIGNAPTALMELLRLVKEGKARPALIIGVPVGFVGAQEAKESLMASGLEYIAVAGRKGGSPVAAAIVNALAITASKES